MEAGQAHGLRSHREWGQHTVALVLVCDLLILIVYVWFISVGVWTHWPASTAVYDQLAVAFSHGHTWLDQQPSPQLLVLSNPYDPAQRGGLPYPVDFSLYQGRYYLYFGPAPALLLLAAKPFYSGAMGDQHLAFVFTGAIAVLQSFFIARLRLRFFPEIPRTLVAAHILAAALVGPFTPSLGTPNVYLVSVASGQAFFFGRFL